MTPAEDPSQHEPEADARSQPKPWVATMANWLDTRYRVPGTDWKFGLDAVIGLVPVAGDTLTTLVGSAMLVEAVRLKVGPKVIAKMVGNLAIDWVVGLVPGADLVLDVAFKAHARNAKLLMEAADGGDDSSEPDGD